MDDGFHLLGAGVRDDFRDGARMVVERGLVERPLVRFEVDARAPVLEPDVETARDEVVDEGRFDRGTKDVGAYAGAVDEQDGSPGGRRSAAAALPGVALPRARYG